MDQSFSATDFASTERFGNSGREKRGVTSAVGTRVSTPQASEKTNDGTTCRSQRTVRKDRLKEQYLSGRHPVISIDTKKKEMLGDFYRDGVTDAVEPTIVNDHDFASASDGKVIPHGIYDVAKNEASVHLNSSCDTSELACDSIELWFREQGHSDYPDATDLLVLCDGGGSNSSSHYIFKEDLQALSNRLGLKIRICHYPPYLLQVQSDRASCLPARDPSLQGRPARNHRDRQALHRKNRNDQGAQGSCPHARQGVSDRTQIRQGLQAKHDHQIRRIPAKMELHRHPRWPLKSGIYFGTIP